MTSLFQDISKQIETALEADLGFIAINDLRLSVNLYYYVMTYGLKKHNFNRHQIRQYLKKLVEQDYEEWSKQNKKMIELNGENKIVEKEVKQNV